MMWGKYFRTAVTAATLLGLATPAMAAKTVTLDPISPWNVNWSETTCTLRRMFGTKEHPSMIMMERFGPYDHFQLVVSGPDFKGVQQGTTPVNLRFGDAEPKPLKQVTPGKAVNGTPALFLGNLSLSAQFRDELETWSPRVTHATEAATKSIAVLYGGKERIFATGPLDKAFDAMRTCTDNLVAHWGFDPKQQASLTKRAEPLTSPARWLNPDDYPGAMRQVGKQALVAFRLSVDAQGKPTACEIQRSYNDKTFDEVTCAIIMRRARFSPAQDAKGEPIASYYLNTVRWIMQ
ncbi:TonB family protein [Novosphingobium sp. 9U]|uniref:TonB family protein n=1 Tax=Novosphingobium sp. 9U TaxID=2653158 RepID=UPI0012EFA2A3|nr:TonB family protein [Novosphingobium sp. 9U]VWX53618.1 conserved exported hypothetical protein [Novosphingobium sp. 9U]